MIAANYPLILLLLATTVHVLQINNV